MLQNLSCSSNDVSNVSHKNLSTSISRGHLTKPLDISLDKSKNNDSILSTRSYSKNDTQSSAIRKYIPSNDQPSWSINTDSIKIEILDIKKSNMAKFFLTNHLKNKELYFSFRYQAKYIDIEPKNTPVGPLSCVEYTVMARREVLEKLPWFGNLIIASNKIQKDIRIELNTVCLDSSRESTLKTKFSVPYVSNSSLASSKSIMNTPCSTYSKPSIISTNSTIDTAISDDLTQHMLESSLSLTPLINANLTILNVEETTNNLSNAKTQASKKTTTSKVLENEENDSSIRIKRIKGDSHIYFPILTLNQRKLIEFVLTNQANTFVNWRAFSLAPTEIYDGSTTYKSAYSTFYISPQSGVIPPLQKQSIKIEFSPRDVVGSFLQVFQIETRTDPSAILSDTLPQISYSCQLVLRGISCQAPTQQVKREIALSSSNLSLASTNASSLVSDSSTLSSSSSIRKVTIKTDPILFENTKQNQVSKAEICIQNKENFDCKISILPIQEPFFIKHTKITIISMRCIKIPIEFKPTHVRDFRDKISIRVEGYDTHLSCTVQGKCVP